MKKILALLLVAALGVAVWWFTTQRGKGAAPPTPVGTGSGSASAVSASAGSGAVAPAGPEVQFAPSPAVVAAGELDNRAREALTAAVRTTSAMPAAQKATQLSKLIDALIAKSASDARERSWDPTAIIAKVGTDRTKLFSWVKDQTALVPYVGSLRGAVGVLMDRVGNSLDRSLLLADLLTRAGGEARLAHATLDPAAAEQLATAWMTAQRPAFPTTSEDLAAAANLVAAMAAFSGEAAVKKLVDAQNATSRDILTKARAQVVAQVGTLAKAIEGTPAAASSDAAVLADHWWVQVHDGDAWIDFDPTQAGVSKVLAPATETIARDALPETLRHMLAIRVIGEVWHGDAREETTLVEHAFAPADFYGQRLSITTVPVDFPALDKLDTEKDRPAAVRTALIAQTEWFPMIQMGVTPVARFSVTDAGELYDLMDANGNTNRLARVVQQATKKGVGGATEMLEGMADGTGSAEPLATKPAAGPHSGFTAEWIEIEVRTPGVAPRVIRRTVFDAFGGIADRGAAKPVQLSDAAKLDRGLALTGETEVLAQFARVPESYNADRLAKYLTAVKPVHLAVAASGGKSPSDALQGTFSSTLRPPDELDTLALARFALSDAEKVFVDQLDVLTARRRIVSVAGALRTRKAFDILTNGVGAWGNPAETRTARIAQGIADTVAESVLRPCSVKGEGCFRGPNTSDAYVGATTWTLITDPAAPTVALLSPDARAVAVGDLASGYALVAPPPGGAATWWRVRPDTGEVLGQAALGGSAFTENLILFFKFTSILGGYAGCFLGTGDWHLFGCVVVVGVGGVAAFVTNQLGAAALGFVATMMGLGVAAF